MYNDSIDSGRLLMDIHKVTMHTLEPRSLSPVGIDADHAQEPSDMLILSNVHGNPPKTLRKLSPETFGAIRHDKSDSPDTPPGALDSARRTDPVSAGEGKVAVEVPFQEHLDEAVKFIIGDKEDWRPGIFGTSIKSKSTRAIFTELHLKEFVEYMRQENEKSFLGLSDEERRGVIREASQFIEEKMSAGKPEPRAPYFGIQIFNDTNKYLEFLEKESIILKLDNSGQVKVTRYIDRDSALRSLTGAGPGSDSMDVMELEDFVLIGGIKLPIKGQPQ
jgi:hypothetical protein